MDGGAYQAFNCYLAQFLEALLVVFPEEQDKTLGDIVRKFPMLSSLQPKEPHRLFMERVAPHYEKLTAHDDSVIRDGSLDIPGILDVKKLWTDQDVSEESRATMWNYIDTLVMLGGSISSLPSDMMGKIESIAASIHQDAEASGEMPNMMDIFARVQRETANM